jgi:thiamine pyrophosphate-dependent acetolactate synthase large subunit-like protein
VSTVADSIVAHLVAGGAAQRLGASHDPGRRRLRGGARGLLGFASGYRAMESCDALLVLGADFPYRDFYPKDVPVVQVDVRGEQIGRRVPVEYPLVGTVKDTLPALVPLLKAKDASDRNHLGRMRQHYVHTRRDLDKLARADHDRSPLHPQYVTQSVRSWEYGPPIPAAWACSSTATTASATSAAPPRSSRS